MRIDYKSGEKLNNKNLKETFNEETLFTERHLTRSRLDERYADKLSAIEDKIEDKTIEYFNWMKSGKKRANRMKEVMCLFAKYARPMGCFGVNTKVVEKEIGVAQAQAYRYIVKLKEAGILISIRYSTKHEYRDQQLFSITTETLRYFLKEVLTEEEALDLFTKRFSEKLTVTGVVEIADKVRNADKATCDWFGDLEKIINCSPESVPVEDKNTYYAVLKVLNSYNLFRPLADKIAELKNDGVEVSETMNTTYTKSGKYKRTTCRPSGAQAGIKKEVRAILFGGSEFDIHQSVPNMVRLTNGKPIIFEDALYTSNKTERGEQKIVALSEVFTRSTKEALNKKEWVLNKKHGQNGMVQEEILRVTPIYKEMEKKLREFCEGDYRATADLFAIESLLMLHVAAKLTKRGTLKTIVYDCLVTTVDETEFIKREIESYTNSDEFKKAVQDYNKNNR